VKKGVTFHPVSTIEEVLAYAFPNDAKRPAMQKIGPNESERDEIKDLAVAVGKAVAEAIRG
jgi:hypothetical protein